MVNTNYIIIALLLVIIIGSILMFNKLQKTQIEKDKDDEVIVNTYGHPWWYDWRLRPYGWGLGWRGGGWRRRRGPRHGGHRRHHHRSGAKSGDI